MPTKTELPAAPGELSLQEKVQWYADNVDLSKECRDAKFKYCGKGICKLCDDHKVISYNQWTPHLKNVHDVASKDVRSRRKSEFVLLGYQFPRAPDDDDDHDGESAMKSMETKLEELSLRMAALETQMEQRLTEQRLTEAETVIDSVKKDCKNFKTVMNRLLEHLGLAWSRNGKGSLVTSKSSSSERARSNTEE